MRMSDEGRVTRNARRDTGVTLIEVIVVIVILMLLMGLSVAVFRNSNRDLGVRASANHCIALIRSTSEHARTARVPAWIALNVDEGTIHTLTEETIQAWNFEDARGAFGKTCTPNGGTFVPGREGLGYAMRAQHWVDCGEVPVYQPDQGLGIEFWLHRTAARGRSIICKIGEQVEVAVDGAGRIYAKIGSLALNSKDMNVPLEKWAHVKAIYNGTEGKLYLNGVEVDARQGRSDWTRNSPLVIGDKKDGIIGIVDSFRLSLIIPRDKYYLPREVKFILGPGMTAVRGEYVIGFTPEGRLDPARHTVPVTFTIKSPADESVITVSPLGGVMR